MMPLMISANRLAEQVLTQSQALFYRITDPNKARVLQTKRDNLTYLLRQDLLNLYRVAQQVERAGVPGIFVEAGCALGGSSITIGMAKAKTRPLHVYDAFGMIPPPSDKDNADVHSRYAEIKSGKSKGLGKDTYYGYIENLQEVVEANLAPGGVMVFDDYSEWSGCRTAVDNYFKDKQGYHQVMKGRKLHVTKVVSW